MATFAIIDSSDIVVQIVEAANLDTVTALELKTIYGGADVIAYSGKRCGIGLKYVLSTDSFDDA